MNAPCKYYNMRRGLGILSPKRKAKVPCCRKVIYFKNPTKSFAQFRLLTELSLKLQSMLGTENVYEEMVTAVQNKFHYHAFTIWSVSTDNTATLRAQSGVYNKFIQPGFTIKTKASSPLVIKTKNLCRDDVTKDPHFTSFISSGNKIPDLYSRHDRWNHHRRAHRRIHSGECL